MWEPMKQKVPTYNHPHKGSQLYVAHKKTPNKFGPRFSEIGHF